MNNRKRKRPITSCTECYRRKQKCDREQPCAICTIRGIPEKCSFDGYVIENRVKRDIVSLPLDHKVATPVLGGAIVTSTKLSSDISLPASDLGEQIGYSSANYNNLSILQKSLQHDETADTTIRHQPTTVMPNFTLYQISQVEQHLPSEAIQKRLVDLYFGECWWWFHGLEPVSFRHRLAKWHATRIGIGSQSDPKDDLYFAALLFQVLAIGLQYLEESWTDVWQILSLGDAKAAVSLSLSYSNSGAQIMDLIGRHDSTVTAVQHDMTRGVWLKNASRGTEAWYSLGNAIRQAQELRLHLKQEPPLSIKGAALNTWRWDNLLRHRIWACLFSWDAHVAFSLGRPRIINAVDCARMEIVVCDIPDDTSLQPPPTTQGETSYPYLITPLLFHYAIGYLIHKMLDRGAGDPSLSDYSILDSLYGDVNDLLKRLPPHLRLEDPDPRWDSQYPIIIETRLHLHTITNTYLVALHRAHVLRRPESCEVAVTSALKTLTAQEQLLRLISKPKWRIYTYSFYTIDASIFLAALLLEQPKTVDDARFDQILSFLKRSLDRLELVQDTNQMAKAGAQVLKKCLARLLHRKPPAISLASLATQANAKGHVMAEPSFDSIPTQVLDDTNIASLRSWIEQMDRVMLPMLEAEQGGPFDNALWEVLLEG